MFILYSVIYSCGAVGATIYSYHESSKTHDYQTQSLKKKLILFWHSLYSKNRMYGGMIVHIFDTASDLGVLIEWYILSYNERNNIINIPHLNMTLMFYCNLFALILYRLISCVWVYHLTKSIKQAILQFFDLLLFKAIYVNYKLKRNEPSNPQKYLQKLEGIFESTPQACMLINIVYILFYIIKYNISYII